MAFREWRRLNEQYGASKGMKTQLFNMALAQGITNPLQVTLRFGFGSLNSAQVESIHTGG